MVVVMVVVVVVVAGVVVKLCLFDFARFVSITFGILKFGCLSRISKL